MSAQPNAALTPTLSEGHEGASSWPSERGQGSSLSLWERAGVRVGIAAALITVAVLVPVLNLVVLQDSAFHLSDYAVQLIAKIMCYAICALAMDLIWGYTGILSLGHGVFFALGGYAMGMYLMRQIGSDGQYRLPMPDFMVFLNWKEFPVILSSRRCCWSYWCRACSPSCLVSSRSARASRACTSRSSRRR
jgi:urea transport system permease protein